MSLDNNQNCSFPNLCLSQVIYALNTKNDEHKEEIESMKEAHEDEVC